MNKYELETRLIILSGRVERLEDLTACFITRDKELQFDLERLTAQLKLTKANLRLHKHVYKEMTIPTMFSEQQYKACKSILERYDSAIPIISKKDDNIIELTLYYLNEKLEERKSGVLISTEGFVKWLEKEEGDDNE